MMKTDEQPTVSIISPAYNVEAYIGRTLEHVLAQTLGGWEYVVVDDGSTDGTAAVVESFARRDGRVRLLRQPNKGPSAARNAGFAASSAGARYVSFMDADDLWEPDALATLVAAADGTPGVIGAHGLGDMIDADDRPLLPGGFEGFGRSRIGFDGRSIVPWPAELPTSFETVIHVNKIYPPGLMIARRRAYEKVGPFDEALAAIQDWDMVIRLLRLGDLAFVDRVILKYRRHATNVSDNPQRNIDETRLLHHKTFYDAANTPSQRAMLRKAWRAFQRYKMREKLALLRDAAAGGQAKRGLLMAGHVAAHALRHARGTPRAKGL